jgi:protein O-GlcNAc transferase
LQALAEGTQAANPLTALLLDDPSQSRADAAGAALEAARLWAARIPAQAAPASNPRRTGTGERIRIAYVSTDFHEHAVARLLAGVLESHDRARFEIVGVALGPARAGAMRERLAKACDRFLVCANESDARIAHGIRAIDADIAIDLNGYTMGSRSGIFARRPAPVQVNYLGFAGSMGAPYYDYLIADPVVVPEKDEALFDEKIVRLPHSYLPYDRGRRITPRPSRTQAGLPETGFVFCAFNNPFKFTPELFSVWMRLLAGAPGSVLWLGAAADAARANLAREAQARGVSGERLVFAPLIAADEDYLARMSLADLFLDTLPYNAHATAMDALWAGVPVLTVKGGTFPGRVAASLLGTAGLSELATDSLDAYEAAGAALARDRDALQAVKAGLRAARDASALFDTPLYTRHLESAYARMWERHLSGAPPQAFAVRAAEGA